MGTFPIYILSKWLKVKISNRFLLKWQPEKADGDRLGHVAHACSGHLERSKENCQAEAWMGYRAERSCLKRSNPTNQVIVGGGGGGG